jgi:hypothetical protein
MFNNCRQENKQGRAQQYLNIVTLGGIGLCCFIVINLYKIFGQLVNRSIGQ